MYRIAILFVGPLLGCAKTASVESMADPFTHLYTADRIPTSIRELREEPDRLAGTVLRGSVEVPGAGER